MTKGVQACNLHHLEHEARIYRCIHAVQGDLVPVFCGIMELQVPYLYDNGRLTHVMLMSRAGLSVLVMQKRGSSPRVLHASLPHRRAEAVATLRKLSVIHGDMEERNMTYDPRVAGRSRLPWEAFC